MNKFYGLLMGAFLSSTVAGQPLTPFSPIATPAPALTLTAVSVQSLQIGNTGARPVELVCPRKGPTQSRPSHGPAEPTELPDVQDIEQALQEMQLSSVSRMAPKPRIGALRSDNTDPLRMAIWGDSHMAAAFFSD